MKKHHSSVCNGRLYQHSRVYHLLSTAILVLLQAAIAYGQDGWSYIAQNDHVQAKQAFLKVLERDSTNVPALQGMIVLSELEGNDLAYEGYVNSIITNHWDEYTYLLFRGVYDGGHDSAIATRTLSERAKVYPRLQLASDMVENRKWDEANKVYRYLFADLKWSMIGPFKNIGGSGHIITRQVETEPYNKEKLYEDESGWKLGWLEPTQARADREIAFYDHFPTDEYYVFYANTFIDMPEDRNVQLRLTRSSPIKVWVDDSMVFESPEIVGYEYDAEVIGLRMKKGVHRILIKLSPMARYSSDYDLFDYYDSRSHYDERIAMRITDTAGVAMQDVRSVPPAPYTPGNYKPDVQNHVLLEYYKKQVAEHPENLFNSYALCKAFLRAGMEQEGEEYFAGVLKKNPDLTLNKYIASKFFAVNGKIENVYETLGNVDYDMTPLFGMLYNNLDQIDPDTDEERYLGELGELRSIAPSSSAVIQQYLGYYSSKELTREKDAFIDEVMTAYPRYEKWLKQEKSDYRWKYDDNDRSRREEMDSLMEVMEDHFYDEDYDRVIDYFIDKENREKVVELYDELIKLYPEEIGYRLRKTRYLFQEKIYDDAYEALLPVFGIYPMESGALELMGDILFELERKDEARDYYLRAWRNGGIDGYDSRSLIAKLEKIDGTPSYKEVFQTKSFEDVLNDSGWRNLYKSEESVVLMFTRDVVLDTLDQMRISQKMMIRIQTEAGADQWTEYNFRFMGAISTSKVIKKNGTEVIPDRSDGYVVFKKLEPGDIIQLEGQVIQSISSFLDRSFYQINYFTFDAPIYLAKYEMLVPKGKYIGYMHHGLQDNLVKSEKGIFDSYKWEYANLPKLQKEDAIVDVSDIYRSIFVSTLPDWSKVVDWYDQLTYRKFELTYDIKEILDTLIAEKMTDKEKVVAVYNYITKEVNYSYVPFFQSAYIPKKSSLTLSSKIGDCKDVATVMLSMLRAIGIESYYVLVKTTSFNHQKMLPSNYFDHVIIGAVIDGQTKYMDLTTNFYPDYVVTDIDATAWALRIKKGENDIFQLPNDYLDPRKNLVEYNIDAKLTGERSLDLEVNATYPGITGGQFRELLGRLGPDEFKNFALDFNGRDVFQDLNLLDWNFENQYEITPPLQGSYSFKSARFAEPVSNLLIFKIPYMLSIPTSQALLNDNRTNSISIKEICHALPARQNVRLQFPAGYELTELPTDISVKSKYGEYTVKFRKTKEGIEVEKYQQFYVDRVPADEFTTFREYYQKIMDMDGTRYAIIKKTGKKK